MSSKSRKPRMNKYNGCYRLIRVIKQHDKRTSGTPGFTLVVFVFVLYRFVVFVFICVNLHYVLSWNGLETYQWLKNHATNSDGISTWNGLETYQWLKQPRNQQRRNLYMKWSGNLPVVKTTTQPTATESLHEMVWKLTSG
jgi:hypothetical protein